MAKRPSLFAAVEGLPVGAPSALPEIEAKKSVRPPSREGKRVLSIYLPPEAWKQLRMLSLNLETSAQTLGEEAINLLVREAPAQSHCLTRTRGHVCVSTCGREGLWRACDVRGARANETPIVSTDAWRGRTPVHPGSQVWGYSAASSTVCITSTLKLSRTEHLAFDVGRGLDSPYLWARGSWVQVPPPHPTLERQRQSRHHTRRRRRRRSESAPARATTRRLARVGEDCARQREARHGMVGCCQPPQCSFRSLLLRRGVGMSRADNVKQDLRRRSRSSRIFIPMRSAFI